MLAVFKREFRAYMNNVYGYLFMAVLLLFAGVMMFYQNLIMAIPNFEYAIYNLEYVLLVMIPVLCMRSMAEDKRNKTDMFYLSLPLKTSSVVLGKYLALLAVYTLPCAVMCVYPLLLGTFGEVNYTGAYLSILYFYVLGAALIAVCQFLSSLTDNLVVSAVLGVGATLILYFIPLLGTLVDILSGAPLASFVAFAVLALLTAAVAYLMTRDFTVTAITAAALIIPLSVVYILFTEAFTGLFATVVYALSPFTGFETLLSYGILDLGGVALCLSYVVLFLFFTVQSADKKRWA